MYDGRKEKITVSGNSCPEETGVKMIKIILCDDNQIFLENLRGEIRTILMQYGQDAAIYTFDNFEDIHPDLIQQASIFFLDIDFEGREYTGIDIAGRIREVNESAVIIFVTNYIQYAPEGYEVQAFRYLLKSDISAKLERCLRQALDKLTVDNDTMMITVSGETVVLPLADILFLESQAHNVVIYVQGSKETKSKQYRQYSTLANMEQQLCERGFLRIQKRFLVNMRRLVKYQCTEATLDTGLSLKVSQKIYNEQKKKYLLWKGGK